MLQIALASIYSITWPWQALAGRAYSVSNPSSSSTIYGVTSRYEGRIVLSTRKKALFDLSAQRQLAVRNITSCIIVEPLKLLTRLRSKWTLTTHVPLDPKDRLGNEKDFGGWNVLAARTTVSANSEKVMLLHGHTLSVKGVASATRQPIFLTKN